MASTHHPGTMPTGRRRVADRAEGTDAMHPVINRQIANMKIAERAQYAERERRIRAAGSSRPQAIDFARLGGRLQRTLLRLGQGLRGAPVGAGA
jgi:hypothetical protein